MDLSDPIGATGYHQPSSHQWGIIGALQSGVTATPLREKTTRGNNRDNPHYQAESDNPMALRAHCEVSSGRKIQSVLGGPNPSSFMALISPCFVTT